MRSYAPTPTNEVLALALHFFQDPQGNALSHVAIENRLATHVRTAALSCPSMGAKPITKHTLWHTTSMNLRHAGVDITIIAVWLGHEQTSTPTWQQKMPEWKRPDHQKSFPATTSQNPTPSHDSKASKYADKAPREPAPAKTNNHKVDITQTSA
ncbi:hypothetical protein [Arthrobacter cryoconiti]|uniref:hypothetical protein n=1 Tax=Arthrobacter cryoconiti TaxID=748907 RepID=UPI003CD084A0